MTGPSSANGEDGEEARGRGSLSRRFRIKQVTPEHLAYIAVLARLQLRPVVSYLTRLLDEICTDNQRGLQRETRGQQALQGFANILGQRAEELSRRRLRRGRRRRRTKYNGVL